MDLRRLDSNKIRQVFHCKPPERVASELSQIELSEKIEPLFKTSANDQKASNSGFYPENGAKSTYNQTFSFGVSNPSKILQHLPASNPKSTVYIEISIFVVMDQEQEEPELNNEITTLNNKINHLSPVQHSYLLPKPLEKRLDAPRETSKVNKLHIPSLNKEIKKSSMSVQGLQTLNNSGLDHSSIMNESELRKRSQLNIENYPHFYVDQSFTTLFNRVQRFWSNGSGMYPFTFKKHGKYISEDDEEFCRIESVDYSNKMIPPRK